VPMGCQASDFAKFLPAIFSLTNICGALITMPHKVAVVQMLDQASTTVNVAGACNAVKRNSAGKLVGDMFDGEGFLRGLLKQSINPHGLRALISGCGGVGSSIAASLANAGLKQLQLHDTRALSARALADRINRFVPSCQASVGSNDPAGFDMIVNCTPLGMNNHDPLPFDPNRISAATFVGEVVMRTELTPLLVAVKAKGCRYQIGTDMLFEQIPAYLEFFGLPSTTAEKLRTLAQVSY
jgi:shikimate dehydrogenase